MRNISDSDILRQGEIIESLLRDLGRKRSSRDPIGLVLEEAQFTPAQVHTLFWLGSDSALTMGEIAARLGITEKTITGVVDRLEAEGYVSRQRSQDDRRVVRVLLTRRGQAVHRRLQAGFRQKIHGILSVLEPEERRALIRIIQKLSERLPGLGSKRSPSP